MAIKLRKDETVMPHQLAVKLGITLKEARELILGLKDCCELRTLIYHECCNIPLDSIPCNTKLDLPLPGLKQFLLNKSWNKDMVIYIKTLTIISLEII